MKMGRNKCMDTIKGLACLLVVLIHYNWSNDLSAAIKAVGRFAVPYFFFVSGYYLPNAGGYISADNLRRKTVHILKICMVSVLVYGVFCIYWNSIRDSTWNVWSYTKEVLSWEKLFSMLVSCNVFVYPHFWYLVSLLWCYLCMFAVKDRVPEKGYLIGFAVLISVYMALVEFHDWFGLKNYYKITETYTLMLSNTFPLRALPYFMFGIYLKKNALHLKKKLPMYILVVLAVIGCVMAAVEDYCLGTVLMYVGTHLTVIALALVSIWYPESYIPVLEYIGNKMSMHVYLYHIVVGKTVDLLYAKKNLYGIDSFGMLRPVIVLFGSVAVAWILVWTKKKQVKASCIHK